MTPDPRRIKELFVAALDQPDAAARQAFLDRECAGDAELRQRLEVLLNAHDAPVSALNRPLAEIAPEFQGPRLTTDQPVTETPGTVIGPYKLLQQIGEGGMGTVWMAQQTEPVKRLVAVKLIKAGMDSKQVIARFEAERQALALMDHANIARVLDGGTTSAGRPYFVMDLVKGVPITKYCDEHHLTPRQRLELFIPVCQAVQHAHQKGIIHRDLKPSNVLVALYDGKPVPKVIDFGVAKATGQSLTEKTLVTGFGAIVGTLEYMSPEQAEINQLDIDTRSDIYSLGVLLYELLAGSPPFSRKALEKAGMLEMLRVIREQEPSKPSTKLSTAEGLPTLAANRGTEPAKLTKLVRGELDWIVMKALEKDRNRRYETANGFAMDVQRYLADEAVQACPPSVGYRFRKFARRNKAALLTAGVIAAVLVLGTVVSSWQAIRARRAEWLAQERLEAETTARGEAERERKVAQAAQAEETKQRALAQKNAQEADGQRRRAEANFLLARKAVDDMYTDVAERWLNEQPELEPLQRDFLVKALKYYQEFAQVKEGEAAVRLEAAQASRRVGAMKAALEQYSEPTAQAYRQAIDILETLVQEFPREPKYREPLAEVHLGLAIQLLLGRKTHEAEKVARRGVSLVDELAREFPAVPRYRVLSGRALRDLARCLSTQEAVQAVRQSVEVFEKLVADFPKVAAHHSDLAQSHGMLGWALRASGATDEAEKEICHTVQLFEKMATEFPNWDNRNKLADTLSTLAGLRYATNRPQEAKEAYWQALGVLEELVIEAPAQLFFHRSFAACVNAIVDLASTAGQQQEAEKARRRSLELYGKLTAVFQKRADWHAHLVADHVDLRELLTKAGKAQEAEAANAKAVNAIAGLTRFIHLKPEDPQVWLARGHAYAVLMRWQDADADFSKAIGLSPDGEKLRRELASWCLQLADRQKRLGRLEAAETACAQAISRFEKLTADFPEVADYRRGLAGCQFFLAGLLAAAGQTQEAEEVYRKVLEDAPKSAVVHNNFAWLLATCPNPKFRDAGRAVELAKKAVELAPTERNFWNTLGAAHYRAGDWKAAVMALEKSMELTKGGNSFDWFFLAMAHRQLGDKEQARKWYDQAIEWMEKNQPQDEELRRFRSEAAQLLGVPEAPKKGADPKTQKEKTQSP